MLGRFSRTELLLGHVAMEKLAQTTVAIFGSGRRSGPFRYRSFCSRR